MRSLSFKSQSDLAKLEANGQASKHIPVYVTGYNRTNRLWINARFVSFQK